MGKLDELLKTSKIDNINPEAATKLVELIIEGAAKAAEESARSFSDGDAASGCKVAASAVKYYGQQLLK